MKIIFASNSSFGGIVLEELVKNNSAPDILITSSDKKSGRGQQIQPLAIKEMAQKEDIKIMEADDKETFHKIIQEESPDAVIVAAFGLIIPEETLKLSNFFNIHPSLLPKYRGATPIQTVIQNGEEESGVTIIKMKKEIDSGPIVIQKSVQMRSEMNYAEAEELLAKIGSELTIETLNLFQNNNIAEKEQNHNEATFTKILSKEDGKINWNDAAEIIERKIRAFSSWPGTYTKMGEKMIKVISADIQKQTEAGPFGEKGKMYLGTNNTLAIQTGKDFLLIKELQLEGKTPTSSKDFLQGNMSCIGVILE